MQCVDVVVVVVDVVVVVVWRPRPTTREPADAARRPGAAQPHEAHPRHVQHAQGRLRQKPRRKRFPAF